MRRIITVILIFVATIVLAADNSKFKFNFSTNAQGQHISADLQQLTYIGAASNWMLLATWEPWANNSELKLMHSLTQYKQPEKTNINEIQFQRIYSYGYIDCRLNQLFILNEFYATQQDLIVLDNKFQSGEYVVDLEASTILQILLLYVCKSKST